jgi:hypothetical protein
MVLAQKEKRKGEKKRKKIPYEKVPWSMGKGQ